MKPKQQLIYLPVKVEDEVIPEYTNAIVSCEGNTHFNQVKYYVSHFKEDFKMVTHWLKPQETFVFTPEQLNEYTQSVIKQALETAAEKATYKHSGLMYQNAEGVFYHRNGIKVSKESIINVAEEIFKNFEV